MPPPETSSPATTPRATLLTIADFGAVQNLKSDESEAILQALRTLDPDTLLLCRDSKDYDYEHARRIMPFGSLVPRALAFACGVVGIRARPIVKNLMDAFAARQLKAPSLLVTVPRGYPRALRRNRELGGINVCYEASAAADYRWKDDTYTREGDPERALYDHFLVISSLAADTYVHQGVEAERLHLVHLGVDPEKFHPAERRDDTFRVLCVGNGPIQKGFLQAVRAWNELELPNAELRIIGNGAVNILKEHAGPTVVLKGFSNADEEMRSADLLLHPSRFDSFGKIVTEAMATGLPVIVSERTGAKDLVIENVNGNVIPVDDREAMKRALRWHYEHRRESKLMGADARERILSSYAWSDFTTRLADAFGRIVDGETGRPRPAADQMLNRTRPWR